MDRGTIRMPDDDPAAPKLRMSYQPGGVVPGPQAFNLRMPGDIRARITEEARKNGRSLNSEIVQRLRVSLENYRR